ncbi:hypothetical protein COL154_000595 [Colletotrichum chrysophilum]|nr:hypothetical protein KNSL1_000126 [Colletotrichum chrysophilum]KAJ0371909.1 hypothetical protein COL154_000595 [Colletotrichum chrysophilum]
MSTQTIKDTLAPRETNGQVVFLKKLHWFKTESQVEVHVDRIIRPRQVEYHWPEKDDTAKKAKKQNMGYVWIVCENKYAAKTLVEEVNLEERKGGFYGRTLEAVHTHHPACGTAHMRPSHATTTPGSTHAALVANIKPTMNGDVLVNSQPQN